MAADTALQSFTLAVLSSLSLPTETHVHEALAAAESGSMLQALQHVRSPPDVVFTSSPCRLAAVCGCGGLLWVAADDAWKWTACPALPLPHADADAASSVPDIALPATFLGSLRCHEARCSLPAPRPMWPFVTLDGLLNQPVRRAWERAVLGHAQQCGSVRDILRALAGALPAPAVLWILQRLEIAGVLTLSQPPDTSPLLQATCPQPQDLEQTTVLLREQAVLLYIKAEWGCDIAAQVLRRCSGKWLRC